MLARVAMNVFPEGLRNNIRPLSRAGAATGIISSRFMPFQGGPRDHLQRQRDRGAQFKPASSDSRKGALPER